MTQGDFSMDPSANSASVFDRFAEKYRDKYMDLSLYDAFYQEFCEVLRPGRACVLDIACGPGNVSRYLATHRPELDLWGMDLAPRMVELAREAVPAGHFIVHDLRHLDDLHKVFDGILCAFGLPYLTTEEAASFITAAGRALAPDGVLYLSTMLDETKSSGFKSCSTGDLVHITYYSEEWIAATLQEGGFKVLRQYHIPSPTNASQKTIDLVIIAKKVPLASSEYPTGSFRSLRC